MENTYLKTYLKNRLGIVLALVVSCWSTTPGWAQTNLWETYNKAGVKACKEAHYAEAETNFLAALKEAENCSPQDKRLDTSLNNLAETYTRQRKYAEAEPLLK